MESWAISTAARDNDSLGEHVKNPLPVICMVLFTVIVLGCVSSSHNSIGRETNLNQYKFVAVQADGVSPVIVDEIKSLLLRKGLTVVDQSTVSQLDYDVLDRLLFCAVAEYQSPKYTRGKAFASVAVKLTDARGSMVFEGEGTYGNVTLAKDTSAAVRQAFRGFRK